jgi:hypothetical protein
VRLRSASGAGGKRSRGGFLAAAGSGTLSSGRQSAASQDVVIVIVDLYTCSATPRKLGNSLELSGTQALRFQLEYPRRNEGWGVSSDTRGRSTRSFVRSLAARDPRAGRIPSAR